MIVSELIKHLEKCNPRAMVFSGKPLDSDAKDVGHVTEIGHSDEIVPTVYLYGEEQNYVY